MFLLISMIFQKKNLWNMIQNFDESLKLQPHHIVVIVFSSLKIP